MTRARYVTFEVLGEPIPQGSMKAFARRGAPPIVTSDNPRLKAWRELASWMAQNAMRACGDVMTGPVSVRTDFFLPRPRARRRATAHTTRPDLDKLCRAINDACTGVVWQDDAQVVELVASKRYADDDDIGAVVRVKACG